MPYKEKPIEKIYWTDKELAALCGKYKSAIIFWSKKIGLVYKVSNKTIYFTKDQAIKIQRIIKWREKGISTNVIIEKKLYLKDEVTFKII